MEEQPPAPIRRWKASADHARQPLLQSHSNLAAPSPREKASTRVGVLSRRKLRGEGEDAVHHGMRAAFCAPYQWPETHTITRHGPQQMRVPPQFFPESRRTAVLAGAKRVRGSDGDIESSVSARQGRIRINIRWTLARIFHQTSDLRDDGRIRNA